MLSVYIESSPLPALPVVVADRLGIAWRFATEIYQIRKSAVVLRKQSKSRDNYTVTDLDRDIPRTTLLSESVYLGRSADGGALNAL